MAQINWTPSQYEAVSSKVCNLLVTAAAGSGKTQVLSGRIINRIIQDKIDIDKILVVTFTKAAASEMRERISKAISKELSKRPNDIHLRRQISLISSADITTMHSFCHDVVRRNFFALNLSPNFRILDESENTLIKIRAIEEVISDLYEEKDEEFLKVASYYGSAKNDEAIIKMIMTLYNFSQTFADPDKGIEEFLDNFNINDKNFYDNKCIKYLMEKSKNKIYYAINLLKKAKSISLDDIDLQKYVTMFDEDISMLEDLINECKDWDDYFENLSNFKFKRKVTLRLESQTKDEADKLRNMARDALKAAKGFIPCYKDDAIYIAEEEKKAIKVLIKGTKKFREKLNEIKREKNVLDFDDLEHLALKTLINYDDDNNIIPSEIAKELQDRYDEIYIDEYQDSNHLQDLIFDLISKRWINKPNMFMVGDVKQSIYGFRGSEASLILEKKRSYSLDKDSKFKKVILAENFRCRKQIVDGVNDVFSKVFTKDTGIEYNDEEKLIYGALDYTFSSKANEKNDIILIKTGDEEQILPVEKEARCIAKYIKNLINDENFYVFDKSKNKKRRLKYKDITILMRSVSKYAPIFEKELEIYDIPVFADINTGYFESSEVRLIISLLEIIDNPLSDIPLLGVLRSPLFSFDENELLLIREKEKQGLFYHALCSYAKEKNDLGEKCLNFLKKLKEYKKISKYKNVHDLIEYIYNDTNYLEYVLTLKNGHVRRANLKILSERAAEFEKTSFLGLFNFIEFIRKTILSKGDMGSAKELSEDMDVVRIMSIHKSKGLEFPVVFVARGSARFNLIDISNDLLCHKKLGLGLTVINYDKMIKYPSVFKIAIQNKIKEELICEEIRLLYVALTRAREKLIFTATVSENYTYAKSPIVDDILSKLSFLDFMNFAFSSNHWNLFWDEDILDAKDEGTKKEEIIIEKIPREEIRHRLSYKYPHLKLSKLPSKITVSELKRKINIEDEKAFNMYVPPILKKPKFMEEEKGFTSAEKGTILHFFMQHLDIYNFDIPKQAQRMVDENLLSNDEINTIDFEKIKIFLNSNIAQEMRDADEIYKEVPFNIEISAKFLDESVEDEKILLQGIIDCFYIKDGNVTLVDYKTDFFNSEEEILQKYKKQLDFYQMAIEKKNIYKVNKKFIYLFYNNSILRVD